MVDGHRAKKLADEDHEQGDARSEVGNELGHADHEKGAHRPAKPHPPSPAGCFMRKLIAEDDEKQKQDRARGVGDEARRDRRAQHPREVPVECRLQCGVDAHEDSHDPPYELWARADPRGFPAPVDREKHSRGGQSGPCQSIRRDRLDL